MRSKLALCAALAGAATLALPGSGTAQTQEHPFTTVVSNILALAYQPAYVPAGLDTAFPLDAANPAGVPNTAPAQDYTSGSVPGSPDHPNWPTSFTSVRILSSDGAPLRGYVALHPGSHPGIVVVHGFNTHARDSVIRWAAMFYASGYNVAAIDQRDFNDAYTNDDGYPNWLQTFGWKESQDVLAAAAYLKSRPGVKSLGIVGFSEGAQNAILALAHDTTGLFSAGLTFSPPADQNTQIWSTRAQDCVPRSCTYPVSSSLIALVVPPYGSGGKYDDPCGVLDDAAGYYGTTPTAILDEESAYHAQQSITVPLLNFLSNDDSFVQPFQATMLAGYEQGHPLQRTVLIQQGEHAYFYDRWWDQKAMLLYFKNLLPAARKDPTISVEPTVLQTSGGAPLATQLVDLGNPTPAEADALGAAPDICPIG